MLVAAYICALTAIPVATVIAILKYRVYDIDRLINRTLVYGLLTTLLASVYAAVVLVLGQVFGGIGTKPPTGAVAGATLAVAALFQPARHRIQAAVDRHSTGASTTRSRRLRRSAADCGTRSTWTLCWPSCWRWSTKTMQPTQASLWLRPFRRCAPGPQPYDGGPPGFTAGSLAIWSQSLVNLLSEARLFTAVAVGIAVGGRRFHRSDD